MKKITFLITLISILTICITVFGFATQLYNGGSGLPYKIQADYSESGNTYTYYFESDNPFIHVNNEIEYKGQLKYSRYPDTTDWKPLTTLTTVSVYTGCLADLYATNIKTNYNVINNGGSVYVNANAWLITPTPMPTNTPTPTPTNTPIPVNTNTPTNTPINTPTPYINSTSTPVPTNTPISLNIPTTATINGQSVQASVYTDVYSGSWITSTLNTNTNTLQNIFYVICGMMFLIFFWMEVRI